MKLIYTLGSSHRPWEDFMGILRHYSIDALIDVRSRPWSRLAPYIKKNLEHYLRESGIEYHWLGSELGGLRDGGYEAYTKTVDFMEGISLVEKIASAKTSAIMCAERLPWECHRKWIAEELSRRGWTVEQIIDREEIWRPELGLFDGN